MTKLKAPLLSLKATGGLAKLFSLAKRQGRHIIERKPIPTDAKSPAQLFNRNMFSMCKDLWLDLSDAEHQEWESLARPKHMSGYAWYISQCLRPNPGIYLPLIGGTMSGNIDMATNRILDLPDPTVNQEPDTRAARIAAILAHIAVAGAHHARYTDAEVAIIANALIAVHAALVTGVHGAGDSILATTADIVTHAAIAAAHHARYADAEAVTAAKTVKLDDFATPDDNTDLNASAARHGLFKKLSNVATQFLNGLGNWVEVAGEAATKEFFVPPSIMYTNGVPGIKGIHSGLDLDANGERAYCEFLVPHDFTSLTAAVLLVIANATKTHRLNYDTNFAAAGEAYNTHADFVQDIDVPMNANNIYAIDISAALTNIAAGDYVGGHIYTTPTNTADVLVLGLKITYS